MTDFTVRLTVNQPTTSVNLTFEAVAVVVANPTSSPVYIRTGAPDLPSSLNANVIVPAATAQSFPVTGARDFGLALGLPNLLTGTANVQSGLFSVVTITFLDDTETIPSYGNYSFLSLSLADLTGGQLAYGAGGASSAWFDIGAWGGAVVSVLPGSASGQARITVTVSDTPSGGSQLGAWAAWPGIPVILVIPRITRYFQVTITGSGIAGQPALIGTYGVRASLEEVQTVTFQPGGAPLTQAYNVPQLGTQTFYFITVGMPSVSIRVNNTSGALGEMVWWTGPTSAGPWSLVAFREQALGATGSIFRSVGNLDAYLRIDLLDLDIAAGGIIGTLALNSSGEPDLTSALQGIFAALGDVGQATPNVNQSIYHELDSIRAQLVIQTPDIDDIRIADQSIDAKFTTLNTAIATINTNIATLTAGANIAINNIVINANVTAAGVFQSFGALMTPGNFITGIIMAYQMGGPFPVGFFIDLAVGPPGAPSLVIYTTGGISPDGLAPHFINFGGAKGGGFIVPVGYTTLFAISSSPNTFLNAIISHRVP